MTSSLMCICGPAHVNVCVFVFIFTLSGLHGLEHAHLGTNSPHIDVAQAKIDAKLYRRKL